MTRRTGETTREGDEFVDIVIRIDTYDSLIFILGMGYLIVPIKPSSKSGIWCRGKISLHIGYIYGPILFFIFILFLQYGDLPTMILNNSFH